MTICVNCDWCGEDLMSRPRAALDVTFIRAGSDSRPYPKLDLCTADRPGGSCYDRAIAAICGTELEPPPPGYEWRLMPTRDTPTAPGPLDPRLRQALNALPPRCRYALPRAGVTTLEQVAAMTDDELLEIPGVGPLTLDTLRAAVDQASA